MSDKWNAADYQEQFSYVWKSADTLLDQLNPQEGERILDLGCGTGQLTAKIAQSGASVIGIDSDSAMIEQAIANYPHIAFKVADAINFHLPEPVDAVFSNAALHWVTQPQAAANCIAQALKPGGRFIAELGAKGNVQTILKALEQATDRPNLNPWYFPSVAEYASILEEASLEVIYAALFDRPTPLDKTGLAGWLEMFGQRFFSELSSDEWTAIVTEVEKLSSQLHVGDRWIADYRRLRVTAMKQHSITTTE